LLSPGPDPVFPAASHHTNIASAGRGVIKVMTIVGVIVVVAALAMFVWWLAAGKTGSGPGDNKEPPKLLPTPVGLVVPVPR
jgi:flagellar basal body-associated protein FliL